MKSKIGIIVLVIVGLFLISYGVSWFAKDETTSNKIAVIPINGMIVSQDATTLYQKTIASPTIMEFLKSAIKNEHVKGIVLDINSPGGTVVASKEIAEVVKSSPKPVVAFIHEIGTSGAYWIATAADEIVADPLSITGSIGVTASYLEFSKLFEEYGVTYRSLKAGKFKDIGSPFKELTAEEQTLLEQKLDKIHDAFIREVATNRNLTEPAVRTLATGIYFLGEEAQELGLIDTLGNKERAISRVKERANITDAKLITFKKERSVIDALSSLSVQAFYSLGRGIGEAEVLPLSAMPIV